jgi:hypothetical protein
MKIIAVYAYKKCTLEIGEISSQQVLNFTSYLKHDIFIISNLLIYMAQELKP